MSTVEDINYEKFLKDHNQIHQEIQIKTLLLGDEVLIFIIF